MNEKQVGWEHTKAVLREHEQYPPSAVVYPARLRSVLAQVTWAERFEFQAMLESAGVEFVKGAGTLNEETVRVCLFRIYVSDPVYVESLVNDERVVEIEFFLSDGLFKPYTMEDME